MGFRALRLFLMFVAAFAEPMYFSGQNMFTRSAWTGQFYWVGDVIRGAAVKPYATVYQQVDITAIARCVDKSLVQAKFLYQLGTSDIYSGSYDSVSSAVQFIGGGKVIQSFTMASSYKGPWLTFSYTYLVPPGTRIVRLYFYFNMNLVVGVENDGMAQYASLSFSRQRWCAVTESNSLSLSKTGFSRSFSGKTPSSTNGSSITHSSASSASLSGKGFSASSTPTATPTGSFSTTAQLPQASEVRNVLLGPLFGNGVAKVATPVFGTVGVLASSGPPVAKLSFFSQSCNADYVEDGDDTDVLSYPLPGPALWGSLLLGEVLVTFCAFVCTPFLILVVIHCTHYSFSNMSALGAVVATSLSYFAPCVCNGCSTVLFSLSTQNESRATYLALMMLIACCVVCVGSGVVSWRGTATT